MVASSVRAEPAERRRRVLGVVGWQAAVVGLVHHQKLEPARAVLLVDLDAELMARGALARLALQLAAQAEGGARAGLADIDDRALGVGNLIDAELARQAIDDFRRQRTPGFVEAQPERHVTCPGTWRCASPGGPSCLPGRPGSASPPAPARPHRRA